MDFIVIDVLITMLILGFVQLLVAGILMQARNFELVRTQFEYYFLGVAVYTILCLVFYVASVAWEPLTVVAKIHFFGGAAALAVYHFVIIGIGLRLRFLAKRMKDSAFYAKHSAKNMLQS